MTISDVNMVWVIVGLVVLICSCWFIGRMFDPTYRVKRMRQFLRTNTIVMKLITKDRKTIDSLTVNIDNARIRFGDTVIVIDKTRIYREDKKQDGFFIKRQYLKWEEGVPTIYVYADSFKPADFFDEPSKVSAEDVGTVMISFVRLEIMKGLEAIKKYEMFFYAIGFLALLAAGIAFFAYTAADAAAKDAAVCKAGVINIQNHFGIVANESFKNNSQIVIRGG